MQKTYKCKNGHKFKKEEEAKVICPTCNEAAELMKWNTVDEFSSSSKGPGVIEEVGSVVGSVVGTIKNTLKW
jgi:hypothetical protein